MFKSSLKEIKHWGGGTFLSYLKYIPKFKFQTYISDFLTAIFLMKKMLFFLILVLLYIFFCLNNYRNVGLIMAVHIQVKCIWIRSRCNATERYPLYLLGLRKQTHLKSK